MIHAEADREYAGHAEDQHGEAQQTGKRIDHDNIAQFTGDPTDNLPRDI